MTANNLDGTTKAAIFLMAVGEDAAASVLKHIEPREVQKISMSMAQMPSVRANQVDEVLAEFTTAVEEQTAIGMGNDDYTSKVLRMALGEEKAKNLLDRIQPRGKSEGLEALAWMDPRQIAEIIRIEHPQVIAIVLSYLEAEEAAAVLGYLPDRTQPDVIMRIASLDGIQPHALQELDQILTNRLTMSSTVNSSGMGGLKNAANILNLLDSSSEGNILETIFESDEVLSQKLKDLMFTFDDIVDLADPAIQRLLREVTGENLVIALKGAEVKVREKIFRNMSQRASELLRDDLESKGPVKLSEVEAAQREIIAVVRQLADAGEIAIGGANSEQYV